MSKWEYFFIFLFFGLVAWQGYSFGYHFGVLSGEEMIASKVHPCNLKK